MVSFIFAILALLVLSYVAQADVTGPATVVDGDTIIVAGERIRLEGIDAPELRQTCTAYGQQWIGREGWALDYRKYSTDYLQAESAAKRVGAGLWRGEFTPPWEWRAARR